MNNQEKYIAIFFENYFEKNGYVQFVVKSNQNEIGPVQAGDFLLYYEEEPIAVVEVKKGTSVKRYIKKQIEIWSKLSQKFEYYILISENEAILFNKNLYEIDTFYESLESLVERIIRSYLGYRDIQENKKWGNGEIVYEEVRRYFLECFGSYGDKSDIERITSYLSYDSQTNELTFLEGTELQLFDILLETPRNQEKFYRYLSLDSAFLTINNKKISFSGVVGMNDTTEVDYVENYLFKHTIDDKKKHWRHIERLNEKYIISCTTLEDDLTFWRLYGDDFKGAFFELQLQEPNPMYIIKKVHYAKKNGKDSVLDLIKDVYNYLYINFGIKLVFKNIETWKHFFKPNEYEVEQEVRVLFITNDSSKREWNLTNSHKILNPFMFIDMEELPFKINKIYLGRKNTFYLTNEYQFQQLLRDRKLNHSIEVKISKIANYR